MKLMKLNVRTSIMQNDKTQRSILLNPDCIAVITIQEEDLYQLTLSSGKDFAFRASENPDFVALLSAWGLSLPQADNLPSIYTCQGMLH